MAAFDSLNQFYTGEWTQEGKSSSSQAYALATKIMYALQQGQIKEYKFINSSGRIYGANGLVMDKNGVTVGIPEVRAQYVIGNDLSISGSKNQDINALVEKVLGRK